MEIKIPLHQTFHAGRGLFEAAELRIVREGAPSVVRAASMGGSFSSPVHPFTPRHSVRIIHAVTGEIIEFLRPIKVVELLLEHPNHFVCSAYSLRVGYCFFPLSAHEDLHLSESYVLLPSPKLHSRISPEDMDSLAGLISLSDGGKLKTS